MIDIHSHIIFGVDDGPKTLKESLDLISYSYNKGVREIVATSHRRKGMFEVEEEIIKRNFKILKEETAKLFPNVKLHYGAEIYYTPTIISKLEQNIFPTLANSSYVLVEFSYNISFREIFSAVNEITLLGLKPVIAHIERYNIFENIKYVKEIIKIGAYVQINASSVLKTKLFFDREKNRKKIARKLLKEKLVHFIASDMHNTNSRKNMLLEAKIIIEKKYGIDYSNKLFIDNQKRVINNDYL